MNSKIIALGHSIGPFWKNKSQHLIKKILPLINLIILRESYSQKHINDLLGQEYPTTQDLAFYLFKARRQEFRLPKSPTLIKIASCFREWGNATVTDEIKLKASIFCEHITHKYGIFINFLSTCQGVDNYRDDSKIAIEISESLRKEDYTISREYHNPDALMAAYSKFDGFVGMRLHGAILSMISGVPAFCIGYELKSKGIYEALGLEDLHVSYQDPVEKWISGFEYFYQNYHSIKEQLKDRVQGACDKAELTFDYFLEYYEKNL